MMCNTNSSFVVVQYNISLLVSNCCWCSYLNLLAFFFVYSKALTSLSWQKVCSCSFFFHHFFMAQINIKAYHSINLFVHSSFFFLPTYCCCFYLKKSGDNFFPKINKSDNGVKAFMMRHWCFYSPALEWVIKSELTLHSGHAHLLETFCYFKRERQWGFFPFEITKCS